MSTILKLISGEFIYICEMSSPVIINTKIKYQNTLNIDPYF